MNLFNRAVITAVVLAWVIVWITVILLAILFPDQTIVSLRNLAQVLEDSDKFYLQVMTSLIGGAMILLALLLLLLELTPRQASAVRLTQVTGGDAMMTTEAIAEKVKVEVKQLVGIQQVKPSVTSFGKTARVSVEVRLDPEVNNAVKAEEICSVIRDRLENRAGIKLKSVPKVFLSQGQAKYGQAPLTPGISDTAQIGASGEREASDTPATAKLLLKAKPQQATGESETADAEPQEKQEDKRSNNAE